MENSTTIVGLIAVVAGLLGYVVKLILPYFTRKLDERDDQIHDLTSKFTETINHKTSEHTKAIDKLALLQERHTSSVEQQTEFLKEAIKHIIKLNGKS